MDIYNRLNDQFVTYLEGFPTMTIGGAILMLVFFVALGLIDGEIERRKRNRH